MGLPLFVFVVMHVFFVRQCLEQPECQRLWLDDHLIGPIQRIPRYVLLLKDLLRRTPPDHPDFGMLREVRVTACVGCALLGVARNMCCQ